MDSKSDASNAFDASNALNASNAVVTLNLNVDNATKLFMILARHSDLSIEDKEVDTPVKNTNLFELSNRFEKMENYILKINNKINFLSKRILILDKKISDAGFTENVDMNRNFEMNRSVELGRTVDMNRNVDMFRGIDMGRNVDMFRNVDINRSVDMGRNAVRGIYAVRHGNVSMDGNFFDPYFTRRVEVPRLEIVWKKCQLQRIQPKY